MKSKPAISVCMTFYNAEPYLEEAIESVLDQSFHDFEFLIIDDGSSDNGAERVKKYKDPRIQYILNEHDYIQSLNIGLQRSKGTYIAKMDADDRMHPDRLLVQYNFMEHNPEIAGCGAGFQEFGNRDRKVIPQDLEPEEIEQALLHHNQFTIPILRTAFLKEHQLQYTEDYTGAEDYKLWVDIVTTGGLLANLPMVLYYYRIHEKQIVSAPDYAASISTPLNNIKKTLSDYLANKYNLTSKQID